MDEGFDVNITARAKPDCSQDCAVALAGVSGVALKTAECISPGSKIELRYLSPSQVAAGQPLTVAYPAEQVIMFYRTKRTLLACRGKVSDDPKDVMKVLQASQVCQFFKSFIIISNFSQQVYYI